MIDKKDILKMAKHVFKRGHGIPDKRLFHPKREWIIGLFFAVVVLFIGGIMSTQFFVQYQDISTEEVDSGKRIPQYNQLLIQSVLETYRIRKNKFEAFKPKNNIVSESTTTLSDGNSITNISTGNEEGTSNVVIGGSMDVVAEELQADDGSSESVGLDAN